MFVTSYFTESKIILYVFCNALHVSDMTALPFPNVPRSTFLGSGITLSFNIN